MFTLVATSAVVGLLLCLVFARRTVSPSIETPVQEGDTQEEADPLPAGFRLGEYVIEQELAPALMGRVYKARDVRNGIAVGINVLAPSLRDPVGRNRFIMSAQAAAVDGALGRPPATIAWGSLVAVCEANDIPFVVLKYVEGSNSVPDIARVPWRRPTR